LISTEIPASMHFTDL